MWPVDSSCSAGKSVTITVGPPCFEVSPNVFEAPLETIWHLSMAWRDEYVAYRLLMFSR